MMWSALRPALLCLIAALTPTTVQARPAERSAPPPAAAAAPAPSPSTSPEQWRADLAYMVAQMRARHPDLHHSVDAASFQAAVDTLHARLPALQRHEAIVGLMALAALVGDGHTNVSPLKDAAFGFSELPLKLYWFEDGVFVRAALPGHHDLVGARLEAIGGMPVDTALERVSRIVSRDTPMGLRAHAPVYLAMPAIQHALGLSDTPDASTLTVRQHERTRIVRVEAHGVPPPWPPDTDISLVTPDGWIDGRMQPPPLWLQAPLDYHRMVAIDEHDALYVQLNMVTGVQGQSLDRFGSAILAQVRETRPRTLVVDLRLNRGGNQDLRYGFVADLIRATGADTRLYVLAGRGAFSATQRILDELAHLGDATLVGEPAASRPNSYGDSYRDTLPHSGLSFRTSVLWHQFDWRDPPWTAIDIAVPYRYADYVEGRDPALEVALERRLPPDLGRTLQAAFAGGGAPDVGALVHAHLDDPATRYGDHARQIADAVRWLLGAGRTDAAVSAAGAATARLPGSALAWTLLAYAQDADGQPGQARAAAERVIALDPNNRDVRRFLQP